MAKSINRKPMPLVVLSTGFVLLWLFLAAFPFIWTAWGSFKVEADFPRRLDECNTGRPRPRRPGAPSPAAAMRERGSSKNSGAPC